MRCKRVRRLLSRYLDKELTIFQDVTSVQEHLRSCAACAQEFRNLATIKEALTQKERVKADPSFLYRLKDKLNTGLEVLELDWGVSIGNMARKLIPVPVVCIIVLLFVFLGRPQGSGQLRDVPQAGLYDIFTVVEEVDPFILLTDTMFKL